MRILLLAALVLPMSVQAAMSAEPLHVQIDQLIAARASGPVAGRSSDGEFLRRVTLDLAGKIPTAAEARAFLDDSSAGKRTALIDRLLASPDYARRMQQAWTVMLLERREGKTITDKQWNAYLQQAFAENKPWDALVRDMVAADGRNPATRPGIRFFVDGGRIDHHQMTQDVARLFLGMNIQCAQCHDHPTIGDYKQADYFGLYTYLNQSKVLNDPATRQPLFVEGAAAARSEFESVFVPDTKHSIGPRLPGGAEIEIPQFAKGEEYAAPPEKGSPGIPKFQPRTLLAENLTAGDNRRFVLNSVNRFWFLMMGRGLVHPLDLLHSENPPSHPELLNLLGDEFFASGFDIRKLIREIALSESYQRTSVFPAGWQEQDAPPESYRVANIKSVSAEQMLWSLLEASGNREAVLQAGEPESTTFAYNNYVNGRIKEVPANVVEMQILLAPIFGAPPGEAEIEFNPSMEQALFLMNEKLVLGWLEPRNGNLVDRLLKLGEEKPIADEVYLSVLSRRPEAEETAEVAAYLEKHQNRRNQAIAEIAWALLSSAEFRLNH